MKLITIFYHSNVISEMLLCMFFFISWTNHTFPNYCHFLPFFFSGHVISMLGGGRRRRRKLRKPTLRIFLQPPSPSFGLDIHSKKKPGIMKICDDIAWCLVTQASDTQKSHSLTSSTDTAAKNSEIPKFHTAENFNHQEERKYHPDFPSNNIPPFFVCVYCVTIWKLKLAMSPSICILPNRRSLFSCHGWLFA